MAFVYHEAKKVTPLLHVGPEDIHGGDHTFSTVPSAMYHEAFMLPFVSSLTLTYHAGAPSVAKAKLIMMF